MDPLETLNCLIKGYIITYMNKADGSKLRKKPYVSELLFLTLQQHKKKNITEF